MFCQKFEYGEYEVCFQQISPGQNSKKSSVGLKVLPKGASYEPKGKDAPLLYAEFSDGGKIPLKILRQVQFLSGNLNTYLVDEGGMEYVHKLLYDRETGVFTASVRCENRTKEPRSLLFLSSALFGFQANPTLKITRMGSAYSYAYGLRSETLSDLGLAFENSPSLAFGRDGRFLAFVAVTTEEGVLAIRLESNEKFEIGVKRNGERLEVSCGERVRGGAALPPGGSFETAKAYFTLQPTIEKALSAFHRAMSKKAAGSDDPIVCSAENVSLGGMKRFSALLRGWKIQTAILEDGKKARTEEERTAAAEKLSAEGIRAELSIKNTSVLPPFGRAAAIAAANLSRILPARKLLADFAFSSAESDEETIFKFCSCLMGRVRIRGDFLKFGEDRIMLVRSALSFYEKVWDIINEGEIYLFQFEGELSANPTGKQIYGKQRGDERLLVVHFWEDGVFRVPAEGYEPTDRFASCVCGTKGEFFRIVGKAGQAGAYLFKKKGDNE